MPKTTPDTPSDAATIQIGAARVAILNAGDLRLNLREEMATPEAEWRPRYADLFEQPGVCPSQSVYIQVGDVKLLVDVNDYRAAVTPDSPYALPNYTPPPDLPTQLAALGVRAEDLTDVVITHAHWDHYAGLTTPAAGDGGAVAGYAPTYPHARCFMGQADWQDAEMQTALRDQTSLEARTLGALRERGLLRLVAGRERIADGLEVLPAPGETPGHLIVRLQSEGQTLYVLGDLFHHAVEFERPDWMVTWADAAPMRATRDWLLRDALAEGALLIAAHIPGVGRVERVEGAGPEGALRWSGA